MLSGLLPEREEQKKHRALGQQNMNLKTLSNDLSQFIDEKPDNFNLALLDGFLFDPLLKFNNTA